MNPQIKDRFYDAFLKEPTKDNFRSFLANNCGELDEVDFKETWIQKGHLAKTLLAMANSRGGIIVVGIKEEDDGSLIPQGLEELKDKAVVNNEIAKYIPAGLDYEIFDFSYDSSEYEAVRNKKFQMVLIHDTPDRLTFISMNATTDLEKDVIYVRRGTKCEKASATEIERIITDKINTIFKETTDLRLEEHLQQLKVLYAELPQKIRVLVKKGEPALWTTSISQTLRAMYGGRDVYEEQDNPDFPEERYESFIVRMIERKKLKIEKVLDLK